MASEHSEIKLYDDQLQNDVDRLSLDKLKEMVYLLRSFNMEETSHKLCLITRATTAIESGFCVAPITRYVRCRLSISMRNQDRRELVEAFKRLHDLSSGRVMSGVIFENICHQDFANRIHIKLFPMVRLTSKTSKNESYWFSSHELPSDDTNDSVKHKFRISDKLSQKTQDARNHCIILKTNKNNVNHYGNEKLALKPGTYYVPDKPNEVAFDSFLLFNDALYIFQFTVFEEHSYNEKLISRFAKFTNVPERSKWRFIFIIPRKVRGIKCPFPKHLNSPLINDVELFSAQIVLEEMAEDSTGEESSPTILQDQEASHVEMPEASHMLETSHAEALETLHVLETSHAEASETSHAEASETSHAEASETSPVDVLKASDVDVQKASNVESEVPPQFRSSARLRARRGSGSRDRRAVTPVRGSIKGKERQWN